MSVDKQLCITNGCRQEAKLQCPTCIKLGIHGSYFCSQSCFKGYWETHKLAHKKNRTLRPYSQSSKREVPRSIARPDYADDMNGFPYSEYKLRGSTNIRCLTEEEIDIMRVSCKLARQVLDEGVKVVDVGVTTDEIDRVIHEACIELECYPSPLNYHGFPKSCCTSVNEVICHGIPDNRPLQNGDICNIKPGVKYREVGGMIEKHARSQGYSVVRSYCGHGIHQLFHTAPSVPHYAKNKAVGIMKPGHTFTIEPMISEGVWKDEQWPDHWTAVTADGKLSAQFEETLLVTDTGVDILTKRVCNSGQPYFMDS